MILKQLSHREQQIVNSLIHHTTNTAIAADLEISVNTVKTHLKNIFKKIGVHSKAELIIKLNQAKPNTQFSPNAHSHKK